MSNQKTEANEDGRKPALAVAPCSAYLRSVAAAESALAELINDEDGRAHVAKLRACAQELDRLTEENKFLHDMLDGFEWQRINAMSHEEVRKELLADGYTEERLAAGFAKLRATIENAMKRQPSEK